MNGFVFTGIIFLAISPLLYQLSTKKVAKQVRIRVRVNLERKRRN